MQNYTKIFKWQTLLLLCFLLFCSFAGRASASVSDGTINVTYYTARLCVAADCASGTVVNWKPTEGTAVHIADTGVTGDIWSTTLGWINLDPAEGGLSINTTTGVISGYAWGSSAGWVNFGPFSNSSTAQVTVNSSGELNGYAWASAPGGGWIKFNCSTSFACVKTDWRPLGSRGGGTTGGSSSSGGGGSGVVVPPGTTGGTTTSGTTSTSGTTGTSGTTSTSGTGTSGTTTTGSTSGTSGTSGTTSTGGSTTGTTGGTTSAGTTGGTTSLGTSGTGSTGSSTSGASGGTSGGASTGTGTGGIGGTIGGAISTGFGVVTHVLGSIYDSLVNNFGLQDFAQGIANPVAQSISRIVATTGAIVTIGVTLVEGVTSVFSVQDLVSIPLRLWSLLLGFLGLRRKPWGTVYDSVTKQPIDPAYVVLSDLAGTEMGTSITDLDGRYGFLVKPGQYRLTANKTNYKFPSEKLRGYTSDELYNDLYFGEVITIDHEGQVIAKNIPLDSITFDWNEFAKREQKLMRFYSGRSKTIKRIATWFFYIGFVLATIAFITSPVLYNTVIFSLYIIIAILRSVGFKTRRLGGVVERATGRVVPFSIIRIMSASSQTEIMHRVANQEGRYYCLIQNGTYYVTIQKKNLDGTYALMYTSQPFTITKGYIDTVFEI